MLLRLLLVLPIYLLAAMFIPQIDYFARLFDQLSQTPLNWVNYIALAVLVFCGLALAFSLKHPFGQKIVQGVGPGRVLQIGCVGGLFAALNILFESISGAAPQLASLVLLPLAFMIAEVGYILIILALRLFARPKPAETTGWQAYDQAPTVEQFQSVQTEQSEQEAPQPSRLVRLFTYIFFYALVIGFLPQQEDFQRLMEPLAKVHPYWTFGLSVAALIIGAGAAYYAISFKHPYNLREDGQPGWGWIALMGAGGGLAFGGLINVISQLTGVPGDLETLIVVTFGLVVAELVVALVHYRLNHRFDA